jgi:hypothetical protein
VTGSAYGNPRPYMSVELERSSLEGRLEVARRIVAAFADAGDQRTVEKWRATCDELLDHLAYLDDRAASAALDGSAS